MIYISNSLPETQAIAAKIAEEFQNQGGVIALSGELGSGKTTFTQGFAQSLGIKDKIISPTFVLIRQHPIPKTNRTLYHIDLYRLEGEINIEELGIQEIINNPNHIVLIEWAEKVADQLPKDLISISIQKPSDTKRMFSVNEPQP